MNDGGGFGVGHLESIDHDEIGRKKRIRDEENEMLLKRHTFSTAPGRLPANTARATVLMRRHRRHCSTFTVVELQPMHCDHVLIGRDIAAAAPKTRCRIFPRHFYHVEKSICEEQIERISSRIRQEPEKQQGSGELFG